MIALAAHEEEGPSGGSGGGLLSRPEPSAPDSGLPGEIGCDCGSERCESEGTCGVRPPWAFQEELRLDLLSAFTAPPDREALPAH